MKTFLTARWENLIMANYEVEPSILLPYLPKGVELDFHQGKTYVSLVGFLFKNSSIFGIPIPFLGTFEEINLRFYVKRKTTAGYQRGVVFINETVPYKPVAWLANKLYKEHYIAIPTKHSMQFRDRIKEIQYQWKTNRIWNRISVSAGIEKREMERGSLEEFIFEHYYGYTNISESRTQEYRIHHPRWQVNDVAQFNIQCDFLSMYGPAFSHLSDIVPSSVILAEGSDISVDWKRIDI